MGIGWDQKVDIPTRRTMKLNPFCSSKHHLRKVLLALTCGALPLLTACGSDKIVGIYEIHPNRVGRPIGFIKLKDTNTGLLIESNLKNLTPGEHTFHIHEGNTCAAGIKDGISMIVASVAADTVPE